MGDLLIVGGGITGLSAAYECARAGWRVTLLEARCLGAMASRWTLGGVRQSGRDPAELPLARAAVARWQKLDDELGAPTGYRQHGNLRLARDDGEADSIHRMVLAQQALGLDLTFLSDRAAIRAIAPAIGDAVCAASFCPGDGHADPDSTIAAYAAAARRHGATVYEDHPVVALQYEHGRVTGARTATQTFSADCTLIAAGVHSPALLAPLGITLPLAVKRVLVLQTVATPACFAQVFGVANADCAGRQEINGRFRITTGIGDWEGDTAVWTNEALKPSLKSIADLLSRTIPLVPVIGTLALEKTWGGLIDLTPDALPVLDAPLPGLVIGTGFSGHGFGIGPVTGEILKALVCRENTRYDLTPFRSARFAAGTPSAPLTLHG